MAYLLDTNAWIKYLKSASSKIRERLTKISPSEIFVCAVVKAELFHGARKYGDPERRLEIVKTLFGPYESLPFDDKAAEDYGKIRHELELKGNVIGPNDLMIAAIARVNGLTMVSSNAGEFSRVTGLMVEDWE